MVSSAEKEHRYRDGYGHGKTVTLWETVLQSPYSVDLTEEQARKQMLDELFREDEIGGWVVQRIGITGNYDGGYGKMIADSEWRELYQKYNVMLDRRLKANFRAGYWEIMFCIRGPLGWCQGR